MLAGTAAPWHGPAARDLLCSMLSLTLRDYYFRPSPLSLKLPVAFRIGQFLLCNKQVQKSLWPARVRVCRHARRPVDRPRLSLFWSRPGPGARSSHGRRSSEETRPGRAVSFRCSVHLAHPLACPRPSHKARPPSPWRERRRLRGRCAGEAGGNVCSQSTTSFRFTELTRTAVCFPHRSPAQRQRPSDSGTVLSVVTRGPLPAVRPGPRSPGCPRGPPRAVIFPLSGVSPISKHAAYLPRPDTVLPWLLSPLQAPPRFAVLRSKTPRKGCSESALTISPPNSDQAFILH